MLYYLTFAKSRFIKKKLKKQFNGSTFCFYSKEIQKTKNKLLKDVGLNIISKKK